MKLENVRYYDFCSLVTACFYQPIFVNTVNEADCKVKLLPIQSFQLLQYRHDEAVH